MPSQRKLSSHNRAGRFLAGLLATIFVLLVIVGGTIYYLGYVTVNQLPDRTTIDIKTEELDRDSRKALDDAQRSLREGTSQAGKSIHETLKTEDEDPEELPQELEATPDPAQPPRETPDDEI
jgi:tRNA A37 N6-isopentenylltransferase MiaA